MSMPTQHFRSTVLFFVGVGGFIFELVISGKDRPYILVACLMFCGLPVVFNIDKILQNTSWYPHPSDNKDEIDGKSNKEGS